MPVHTPHKEYTARFPDWEQIADCLAGQRVIKDKGTKYLPKPNAADTSPENDARWQAYLLRSSFVNFTARTVANEVGQVFAVAPVPTLPDDLLPLLANINGDGATAEQQSKEALTNVIAFSRAGLLVDMPAIDPAARLSVAEVEAQGIRPKVVLYPPQAVINWKTQAVGSLVKLSLIVIREEYATEKSDEFTDVTDTQYRVLRFINGVYTVEIWRKLADGTSWGPVTEMTTTPTKAGRVPFTEIPFLFLGAKENSPTVERPLMLDISDVNLAHYRNSADYEEAVYMVGQPTPYAAGLSDSWVNDHLKGQFFIGSRTLIPLPEGGTAGLIQASANTLPKEAMDQKQAEIIALGANVVDQAEVAKTATETSITASVDTAILAAAAKNVSAGYAWAFQRCAEFQGVQVAKPEEEILYELNTKFAISRMSPQERTELRADYQAGLCTFEEARSVLRESGIVYLDDDEAKEEMEAQADAELERAKKELGNQTDEAIRLKAETETEPAAA